MFAAEWEYSGSVLSNCVALFAVKEMDVIAEALTIKY